MICMYSMPVTRHFAMDDEFFCITNVMRACTNRSSTTDRTAILDELALLSHSPAQHFRCYYCAKTFAVSGERDSHVQLVHAHTCHVCGSSFLSEEWVTRHVQEQHDAYFQEMVSRGKAMYSCVVKGCTVSCRSERERRRHLIRTHKLPQAFVRGSTAVVRHGSKVESTHAMHEPANGDIAMNHPAPAATPAREVCLFFNMKKGCQKGDICDFRHEKVDTEEAERLRLRLFSGSRGRRQERGHARHNVRKEPSSHEGDCSTADIDDLCDSIARIRIPDKISFGRRR